MPSRRKLLLLAPLAVVPILAVAEFVFRYDVTGFVRGEAKYSLQPYFSEMYIATSL